MATWKETVKYFQVPFALWNNFHNKRFGSKRKMESDFLRILYNPRSKYLISKRVSWICWQYLWLFTEINSGLERVFFGAPFLLILPWKISLHNTQLSKFQCQTLFLNIVNNVFLSSILAHDGVLNLSIYLQLATYCVNSVIADIGKKRRRGNYKNVSISRTKGAFLVRQKVFS